MNTNEKIEDIHNNINDKVPEQNQVESFITKMDSTEDFTTMKIGSEQVKELWPLAIMIENAQLPKILLKDLPINYYIITNDRYLEIYRPAKDRLWIQIKECYDGDGTVIGEQAMSVSLLDLIKEYVDYLDGKLSGTPKLFYRDEDFRPLPLQSESRFSININSNDYSSPMERNFCIDYDKVGDLNTKNLPKNIRFNFENAKGNWMEEKKPTVMIENVGDRAKITIIENPAIWEYAHTWENPLTYFIIKHDIMLRDKELSDPKFLLYRDGHPIIKNGGDFIYEYSKEHNTINEIYCRACQDHNQYHFDIDRAGEKSLPELQRIFWITNKSNNLINSIHEIIIPYYQLGSYCKVNGEKRFDHIC